MTDHVRWGILGASRFALTKMGPALHLARGSRVAALATRDRERAAPFEAAFGPLRVHGGADAYHALLADDGVDAVYVPLPHTLHVEWALRALEAGKPVLVEKPVAMRADAIAPLVAARDRTGLLCAEAYMIVHHPQWQRVRALLAEGAVGRLRHVDAVFSYDNSADPGNIRNRAATGGGALPDIGVYTLGSTRWATGAEPVEITGALIDWEGGCDVLSRVGARMEGPGGAFTAHWVNSMRLMPEQFILFHGSEGLIRLTAPWNPQAFGEARMEWRSAAHGHRVETWPATNQYVLQVERFVEALGGGAPFPWTLEDARGTQRAIDMAYDAAGGRPEG